MTKQFAFCFFTNAEKSADNAKGKVRLQGSFATMHDTRSCCLAVLDRVRFHRRTFLRTGDLARLDSEGRVFIAGRIKDLVIIRGKNIYPHVR